MTTIAPTTRTQTIVDRAAESLPGELQQAAHIMGALQEARGNPDAVQKVVAKPAYGDLMELLWRASVRLARQNNQADRALLENAARALDICVTDLTVDLPIVMAALARTWVPTTITGELMGVAPANKPDWFPDVKETDFFLAKPYRAILEKIVPEVKDEQGKVRDGLRILAGIARDWSDEHSGAVQARLRSFGELMGPSGLSIEDVRELGEDTQRLMVAATEAIQGLALDADQFVTDVRIDPSDAPWLERVGTWKLDRVADVGKLLEAIADSIELFGDPAAWEATRVYISAGMGLTNNGFAASAAAGGTTTWYMPSLKELREGKTQSKRVTSFSTSLATMGVAGVSAGISGRGMSGGISPGWFSFTESDYWSETGFSIPGIFSIGTGRDRNYGPYFWIGFGKSASALLGMVPVVGSSAAKYVNAKVPGLPYLSSTLQWYHPAFGSIERITKSIVAPITKAVTARRAAFSRLWRRISGREDSKGIDAGWPSDADWASHRPHFQRGEIALKAALQVRAILSETSPNDLVSSEASQKLLGGDADKPVNTHDTIVRYLDTTIASLEQDTSMLREIADKQLGGEKIDRGEVKTLVASIRRQYQAFGWVQQGLLNELLPAAVR